MLKLKGNKKIQHNKVVQDTGIMKVIIFASILIMLSIFLMSGINYKFSKDAIVQKLKTKDLVFIAKSISSRIEGRIDRAIETSLVFANDPAVVKWIAEKEQNEELGDLVKQKLKNLGESYDNSFLVSALTSNYWAEEGRLLDRVSESDSDDSWFFEILNSNKPVTIIVDYNRERDTTAVFIDALVGDISKPIAIAGVGLNLKEISAEFKSYKFGQRSNLWLVDDAGKIYISEDMEQVEDNIGSFLPAEIYKEIVESNNQGHIQTNVIEYTNQEGEKFDLIYQPIHATDWKLVFQMPRSESISILDRIRMNIVAASIMIFIVFLASFYVISYKIADPFRRAMLLNQELERQVNERTIELQETNSKIIDSIEYAKMIQESILPSQEDLKGAFREHFIIWKPKDIVGGDFYWTKQVNEAYLVAVGDCTGHGVPGALMTMVAISALNHIVDESNYHDPARILHELNNHIKKSMQTKDNKIADSGFDIGILSVSNQENIQFAGARIAAYISSDTGLENIQGDSKSIGYESTNSNHNFVNHTIHVKSDDRIYMTSDGYLDQNGGEKGYAFGRKRFVRLVSDSCKEPMTKQKMIFEEELSKYMGEELQRDDITVLGLKIW